MSAHDDRRTPRDDSYRVGVHAYRALRALARHAKRLRTERDFAQDSLDAATKNGRTLASRLDARCRDVGRLERELSALLCPDRSLSSREAARRRLPLDGADAQALEGALAMTERERNAALAEVEQLRSRVAALEIKQRAASQGFRSSLAEVERLRATLGALVRRCERHATDDSLDWACAECRPYSDSIVAGFACSYHTARAVLRGQPEPGEPRAVSTLSYTLETPVGPSTTCDECGGPIVVAIPPARRDCAVCRKRFHDLGVVAVPRCHRCGAAVSVGEDVCARCCADDPCSACGERAACRCEPREGSVKP